MSYDYVQPDEFTPESRVNWISVGKVTKWTQEEEGIVDKFTLFLDGGLKLYIYFLSHCTFRVRFNPDPNAPYVKSRSPATEVERIEASKIKVKEEGEYLHIKTDRIEVSCLGVRGWEVFSSSGMPQMFGYVLIPKILCRSSGRCLSNGDCFSYTFELRF